MEPYTKFFKAFGITILFLVIFIGVLAGGKYMYDYAAKQINYASHLVAEWAIERAIADSNIKINIKNTDPTYQALMSEYALVREKRDLCNDQMEEVLNIVRR